MNAAEKLAWPLGQMLEVLGEVVCSILGAMLLISFTWWLIRVIAAEAEGNWIELQAISRRLQVRRSRTSATGVPGGDR